MEIPETRYATTADGVSIAYQVGGSGPPDILHLNSAYVSNVELEWEWPFLAELMRGLTARGRLIRFDRRGTGLSDKVGGRQLPTLEARMDDIRAVMDAAGSERAVLFGTEDGNALCFLFAATYPERTSGLVAVNPVSRGSWAPDAPWLDTEETWQEYLALLEAGWGTPEFMQYLVETLMPRFASDPAFVRDWGRLIRQSISRADALAVDRMWKDTDVRHVLPTIQAPTLVVDNALILSSPEEESRYIASKIPIATFSQVGGAAEPWADLWAQLDRFLASLAAEESEFDRVLATVLFTDIVDSTSTAAEVGDARWRELIAEHDQLCRALVGRFRGTYVKSTGDGALATFDGPARGVRRALALAEALEPHGLRIRAGLHTGEIAIGPDDVTGIGVHVAARVAALGGASEVWTSSTVKDLVAGSGLSFSDAGEHELKGVPERWHLYRVVRA